MATQQTKTKDKPAEDQPKQEPVGDGKSKGQVAKRPIDQFEQQVSQAMIKMALPPNVSERDFISMVVSAVRRNPELLNCDRSSLLQAVADTAEMGLSLNPNMKEADILPVNKGQGKIAQMRPRAIGLMKLAKQSGEIADIYAHVVHENDHFWYQLGLDKKLEHKPPMDEEDRGAMLQQAYCCWETKDGVKAFELIGPKRINRARAASQGYQAFKSGKIKSTPWTTDEEEMIRKTAVIAATKYMQKATASEMFAKAVAMASDADFESEKAQPTEYTEGNQTIIPPRPTRQTAEQKKRAKDESEKAEREMDQDYRRTMGGHVDDGPPPHDGETGEVIDQDPKPEPEKKGKKAEPKPADYTATHKDIMRKIVAATSINTINAIVETYAEDLNAMQAEAPELYKEIQEGIVGKRAAFSPKK